MAIAVEFHEQLEELLDAWFRQYAAVAPRKKHNKDKSTGTGGAELLVEPHPLFGEQPVGASSDLTVIVSENSNAVEEAKNRSEAELSHRLTHALKHGNSKVAAPSMNPLG